MLKNRYSKLSHYITVDSLAKSVVKTPPNKRVRREVGSGDFINTNSTTHSSENINVSKKNCGATHTTALNSDATRPIDTSSTGRARGARPASTGHAELVQRILDAADMACKAKRVDQLLSYVSGIDYSPAPDSTYEPARSGSDGSKNNEHSLASEDLLIFSRDQQVVFAANTKNRSISSYRVNEDYSLTSISLNVPTSGKSRVQRPISLSLVKDELYIVNAADFDARNDDKPAIRPSVRNCHYLSTNSLCVTRLNVGEDGSISTLAEPNPASIMC